MDTFSFIHASDLHLDAPFLGISRELLHGERLAKQLRESTFLALDRLEKLCLDKKPQFLVLAGDLANSEEQSIRARLRLHALCQSLNRAKIRVFIIHGNHDPLDTSLKSVSWPENVTIFGSEAGEVVLYDGDSPYAVIHGISHAKKGEKRNLSAFLHRNEELNEVFQLGILHCMVPGYVNDGCAPSSLEDLLKTKLDAIALGHVHKHAIIQENAPFIAYAGSPQGLHINEDGEHGCYVVHVHKENDRYFCRPKFHPLCPILWQSLEIDITSCETLEALFQEIEASLEIARLSLPPNVQSVIVRILLKGISPLERDLANNKNDLLHELSYLETVKPSLWIRDLVLRTEPPLDRQSALKRDDLLGSVLRFAEALRTKKEADGFIRQSLDPLYSHSQLSKILPALSQDDLHELLIDAEKLCIQHLEDKRAY